MSKNKGQTSKKQKKKYRAMQIIVIIVLIAFAGYFIFSNIFFNKSTTNNDLDKAMKNKITYTFQKEGELLFTNPAGKVNVKIDIEIAEDDLQREIGLMMRRNMSENQGMLFLFPTEVPQAFWMKNTILPLDIIFVNSQMEIVKIHKNTTPYSEQSYPSIKPSQYVIEVNAGYCDKYRVQEGDKIVWRRD